MKAFIDMMITMMSLNATMKEKKPLKMSFSFVHFDSSTTEEEESGDSVVIVIGDVKKTRCV